MKKYVFILSALEVLAKLAMGKRVEGVLFIDENTGKLAFKAYNRQPQRRRRDRMVRRLEHGWVKESVERFKVYESIPKELGTARVISIMDREHKNAKDAIIDQELDVLEFC